MARYGQSATWLENGKVLITGGSANTPDFHQPSPELYDPVRNSWSSAGSIATFYGATATLLGNGKVLVAGGSDGAYLSSAELYDPVSNSWSAAAPMTTRRFDHTATLLGNGMVL